MSTGRISKGGLVKCNRGIGLRFEREKLIIIFSDGREMAVPLSFYPSLMQADDVQRKNWQMIGPGKGFHWKDLDLDLSVDGLVQGLREAIPRPPVRRKIARAPHRLVGGSAARNR